MSKRIGFALSDELGWTAQPLETFYRRNPDADIRHIQDLVREHEVGQVLVGMPFRLDGEVGPAAKVVQAFIELLEPVFVGPGDHLGRANDDLCGRRFAPSLPMSAVKSGRVLSTASQRRFYCRVI